MNTQTLVLLEAAALPTAPPELTEWAANWQHLRNDVLALAAAYAEQHPHGNGSLIVPLVDELDDVLDLLLHRVAWINGRTASMAVER
ncbi:hypothetical protein SE17_30520 [Kouleothrix aurantiaca]|jgi:hypothetical protein|uniref:Uncharacterized protein n=1 Tax=Kouleothrix aurantiaca TaxID=186479 RepID=A0A0P9DB89_9CHLR|nr:hypothetical protein SE17_30520 [Kouleothrix aurantiaca]